MSEKEEIFSSKIKYNGIFNFAELYKFCYDWLKEETGVKVSEKKYNEKLTGDAKNIDVEWEFSKKITDYFKFDGKVTFKVTGLSNVEITKDGTKIKTNKGGAEISIKGILVRDFDGKFEVGPTRKVLRGIYEKYIIISRVEALKTKVSNDCDEFLAQTKAYLDLEGKR